jgi:hypothetical protein
MTSRSAPPEGAARADDRRRTRRDFVIAGLIGAAVVGAHLVFRRLCYDGEWVPNTFFAKAAGTGDRLEYVRHGLSHPFLGPAGLVAALIGWLIEPRTLRVVLVAGGIGLVGGALPLVTGADWMLGYRLIAPFLPAMGAVVVVGWPRSRWSRRSRVRSSCRATTAGSSSVPRRSRRPGRAPATPPSPRGSGATRGPATRSR